MTSSRTRAALIVLAGGLAWGLFDQVTKYLAVARLTRLMPSTASFGERIGLYFGTDELYAYARVPHVVIEGLWNHVYVQNPAGAFGLLNGTPLGLRRFVFVAVAILAAIGLLWMASRSVLQPLRFPRLHLLALSMVFGGAIGNLTDRIAHGYVIDFIDWHWGPYHWPAFNIADVGIVVGVLTLVFLSQPVVERDAGGAAEAEAEAEAEADVEPGGSGPEPLES
ncbi:MAG: signal peptidase II [Deltaproteobacteria bacterium]|nr:signal peptidase II [Deltaproteobacteria bacterium]